MATGLERASSHFNPKDEQFQRMFKLPYRRAHFTCSQGMLKMLQASLEQYINQELPDVQAGFRKGRETRNQIANICWIIEKARELKKNLHMLH